jgi:hypothetical protein
MTAPEFVRLDGERERLSRTRDSPKRASRVYTDDNKAKLSLLVNDNEFLSANKKRKRWIRPSPALPSPRRDVMESRNGAITIQREENIYSTIYQAGFSSASRAAGWARIWATLSTDKRARATAMGEAQKRVGRNIRIVHLGMGLACAKGSSLNYGHVVVAADRIKATPPYLFSFCFLFIFSSFRVAG